MSFDPSTKLSIDIQAAFYCNDQNPDYVGRLIDIMTEEHTKEGIRRFFRADDGEWDEKLMEVALAEYRESEELEKHAQALAAELFASFMPPGLFNFMGRF